MEEITAESISSRKLVSKQGIPIRTVEDHHVDRSGVEVQQCMKLTDTNRPIGLIRHLSQEGFEKLTHSGKTICAGSYDEDTHNTTPN